MKKGLFVFALIIITAIVFGACDAKGRLNSNETDQLYNEIKAVFETGQIWKYQILPPAKVNASGEKVGEVNEADVDFIRSLSEPVFDESNQSDRYGLWTESKTACRTCVIICSIPSFYDGKSCVVEEYSVTTTRNGSYTVTINFRFTEASDSDNQHVLLRFEPR